MDCWAIARQATSVIGNFSNACERPMLEQTRIDIGASGFRKSSRDPLLPPTWKATM
jgi:hypothetical protein